MLVPQEKCNQKFSFAIFGIKFANRKSKFIIYETT